MSVAALYDQGGAKRPPMPIEACLQAIASAAHLRGAVATRQGIAVAEIPAADLMRALRRAWSLSGGARLIQVETIIRALATRLHLPGPVQISRSVLGICTAYAGLKQASQGKRRAERRKGRGR